MQRMILGAAMLFLPGSALMAAECTDPTGDYLPSAIVPPEADVVSIRTHLEPENFVVEIYVDEATATPSVLQGIGGFFDLDADNSPLTGEPTHCESIAVDSPCPAIGVDYYLNIFPYAGTAELVHSADGLGVSLGVYMVTIHDTSISITLPLCDASPDDGICVSPGYTFAGLLGNLMGPTDVVPNDGNPCTSPYDPADFDQDGDVDIDDYDVFEQCASGPDIPLTDPDCNKVDLDGDGDADQSDFGLFQLSLTGG